MSGEHVIGVELDFEFDKSEQLCHSIEEAYDEITQLINIYKNEYNSIKNITLSNNMFFSDYIKHRDDFMNETSPNTNINAQDEYNMINIDEFMNWMNNEKLTLNSPGEAADQEDTGSPTNTGGNGGILDRSHTQLSIFCKNPKHVTNSTSNMNMNSNSKSNSNTNIHIQEMTTNMLNKKKPITIDVHSTYKHGVTPSKLLQRLNLASDILKYDYNGIFDDHRFNENKWHLSDMPLPSPSNVTSTIRNSNESFNKQNENENENDITLHEEGKEEDINELRAKHFSKLLIEQNEIDMEEEKLKLKQTMTSQASDMINDLFSGNSNSNSNGDGKVMNEKDKKGGITGAIMSGLGFGKRSSNGNGDSTSTNKAKYSNGNGNGNAVDSDTDTESESDLVGIAPGENRNRNRNRNRKGKRSLPDSKSTASYEEMETDDDDDDDNDNNNDNE